MKIYFLIKKTVFFKYSLVCVFPIAFLFSYLLACSGEVWLLKLKQFTNKSLFYQLSFKHRYVIRSGVCLRGRRLLVFGSSL